MSLNQRPQPADDVVDEPSRCAVRAQLAPRDTINQRTFIEICQGFRAHAATMAKLGDSFRGSDERSRLALFPTLTGAATAVVVRRQFLVNSVEIGES